MSTKSGSQGVVAPTYQIDIHVAGSYEAACEIVRRWVWNTPRCVTVLPQKFIYTGGEEDGVVVSLRNYPRFPSESDELQRLAGDLAWLLVSGLYQKSVLIVSPDWTRWYHRDPPGEKPCPTSATPPDAGCPSPSR